MQKELGERRGNWVTTLQEYDLEFKPTTIIKGQGLCKLMAKIQDKEDIDWENEAELHMIDMCPVFTAPEYWYRDLVYYLQQGYLPEHWNSKQRIALCLNCASYQIIDGVIFRRNYDGVFMRCLEQEDASKVVKELHDGLVGGHFSGDTIAHNILRVGYCWPTLFKDSHAYVRKCDTCQRSGGRQAKTTGSLQLVIVPEPFEKWEIDIIG